MDIRYYWIRDRTQQNQFNIYWAPGSNNLADYPSKHHLAKHHKAVRPLYLHTKGSPKYLPKLPDTFYQHALQRCVDFPYSG